MLVQRYLDNPMTVDGRKLNLRVYLLITAIDPLVAWVYRYGYVDLAGAPFSSDGAPACDPLVFNTNTHVQMSLTGNDAGSCSLSLREWIDMRSERHGDGDELWDSVKSMLACVCRSVSGALQRELAGYLVNPNNGFELLGLDVQFERNGRTRLIESNRSPELAALSSKRIKQALIRDLLTVVQPGCELLTGPGEGESGFERIESGRRAARSATVSTTGRFQASGSDSSSEAAPPAASMPTRRRRPGAVFELPAFFTGSSPSNGDVFALLLVYSLGNARRPPQHVNGY